MKNKKTSNKTEKNSITRRKFLKAIGLGAGALGFSASGLSKWVNLTRNGSNSPNDYVQNTAPSNPVEGDRWFDTTVKALKIYDGSQWEKIGKTSKVIDSAPTNPSKGDEWVDTSYRSPAKKVYDGEKWITLVNGNNVPGTQTYTQGTHTVDVSDITSTVEVEVKGGKGQDGTGDFSRDGGSGGSVIANIDLSYHNSLNIQFYEGQEGSGAGGDGGDGVALKNENGDSLVIAGGGGGGQGSRDGGTSGHDGGDGGGSNGGSGGDSEDSSGSSGGINTNYQSVTQKSAGSNNSGASVELFR